MSSELGLPHDPGNHISYIGSWIEALENDPAEIFRASKDAELIKEFTLQFDQEIDLVKEHQEGWERYKDAYKEKYGDSDKQNSDNQESTNNEVREPVVSRDINLIKDLKDALIKEGLVLDKDPVIDGRFHRVEVERDDGKPNKDGSYKAYSDGRPAGIIVNHYRGTKTKWISSASKPLTLEERRKISSDARKKKAVRALDDQKRFDHKAKRAQLLLSLLPKAKDSNAYLVNKGITASDNVFEDKKGRLVVPITDVKGKPQSLVRIGGSGKFKSYMKGAKKAGGMHVIGDVKKSDKVLVCEGYSTGKTLRETTGLPVVVAFDAGNLASVALAVQQAFTKATIFIAGDDDRANHRNAGRVAATDAARAVKSSAIFPYFEKGAKGSDFNDMKKVLVKKIGKNAANHAVRSQIATGIRKGQAAAKHQGKNHSAVRSQEPAVTRSR